MSLVAEYDTIVTPLQIDITTGDAITPKEVLYLFKMIFEEGEIGVCAYNIETVLAEKVETILKRGELNTRPRDFYDIYILTKTQTFDPMIFAKALKSTTEHRKSTHIYNQLAFLRNVEEALDMTTLEDDIDDLSSKIIKLESKSQTLVEMRL